MYNELGELVILLLAITSVKTFVGQDINSPVRLVTYNAGLLPRLRQYDVRKTRIGAAINDLRADIVCLQEVWFSKDMERILETVGTEYPHSYSAVHSHADQLEQVPLAAAPCLSVEFQELFMECFETKCKGASELEVLVCAQTKCGMLEVLDQECITCLILSGISGITHSCIENVGNRVNIPGLLLLSRRPLLGAQVSRFVENKKLYLPRAYITAQVEGVGTVACTHTTANLGPIYFEDLNYSSWQEQNLAEARVLVQSQAHVQRGVIMGDLNSSPAVAVAEVSADMNAAYDYMVWCGYTPSYVRNVGICTWCSYNPLSKTSNNLILDHILTKNMTVLGASRVLDYPIAGENYPLSDHYGIEIVLQIS